MDKSIYFKTAYLKSHHIKLNAIHKRDGKIKIVFKYVVICHKISNELSLKQIVLGRNFTVLPSNKLSRFTTVTVA